MKLMKRLLCLALALIMVLGYIPGAMQAKASQEDGICEKHHPGHTQDCGYQPASDCGHTSHDESCDNAQRIADIPLCECPVGEDGVTLAHTEECTYEAQVAAAGCNHVHGECGYAEEVPCAYADGCPECIQEQNDGDLQPDEQSEETGLEIISGQPDTEHENILLLRMKFNGEEITSAEYLSMEPVNGEDIASVSYQDGYIRVEFTVVNRQTNIIYTHAADDGEKYYTMPLVWNAPEVLFAVDADAENPEILKSLTLDAVGDTMNVKFYYGAEYQSQIGNYTVLRDVEIGEQDNNVISLVGNEDGSYTITAQEEGMVGVVHWVDGTPKVLYVTVGQQSQEQLRLLVCNKDNDNTISRELKENETIEVRCFMAPLKGGPYTDNPLMDAWSDNTSVFDLELTDEENGVYTLTTKSQGTANVVCEVDGVTYTWSVKVGNPQYYLLVTPPDNSNFMNLNGLTIGQEYKLRCFYTYAGPNSGQKIVENLSVADDTVAELSGPEEDENGNMIYTLKPKRSGSTALIYAHTDGRTYSQSISVMADQSEIEADGYLYYLAVYSRTGDTFPKTVVNMGTKDSRTEKFYFGGTLLSTDTDGFSYSGAITVDQEEDGSLTIRSQDESGIGYLEYTVGDITHCLVVNVGHDRPNNEIMEGAYMYLEDDVILGFFNPGIQSNGAYDSEPGTIKLLSQAGSGFDDSWPDDAVYREPVAFGAWDYSSQTPEADVMGAVENVRFSMLLCRNSDGTSGAYASMERSESEAYAVTSSLTAWTNYVVADGKKPFKGLVGMTFDMPDGEKTRRISLYLPAHNAFMGSDVTVEVDVDTAAELNAILSSYEALKKYIKDQHPDKAGIVDKVRYINLKLPGGDLTDAVVVCQAIAPCPYREDYHTTTDPKTGPNFRITLRGPEKGNRTKLAGLISRGSVDYIQNVDFVANEDATMTLDGEEFTCGLMADSTWNGDVVYDETLLELYGDTNGDGVFTPADTRSLTGDFKDLDCDILMVNGCSFTGFDYGTRSTKHGYVGSGEGNSFSKCYYGIYIDCEGKSGWGEITYTGFSGYDFKKNVVAVRILGLQNNVGPYEFRIHDCDFINNYLEFWIDSYGSEDLTQNYYFYRNHYRGGWKLGGGNGSGSSSGYGWVKHTEAPNDEDLPDVHRGPKYRVGNGGSNGDGVAISGTPGSSVANLAVNAVARSGSDGYWIYDGEDQVTRIELDGDTLPIAQEALESLEDDAEISVVDNMGEDTVAVWSFEGGE